MTIMIQCRRYAAVAMVFLLCLGGSAAGSRLEMPEEEPIQLSGEGSGRATAYLESPKIITFGDRTHVAWLDSPAEGFRVRIRTLDHVSGEWSEKYTIGEATDNHGGPALTVDREGYLHVVYYSHHHPFRYRRSLRPNDASEWTPYTEFGENLTYPALLCAKDGTLVLTARRSHEEQPWELELWRMPKDENWTRTATLIRSRYPGYAQFAGSLAWGPDHATLHLAARIYETIADEGQSPLSSAAYLVSGDGGITWQRRDGTPVSLPATADTMDILASCRGSDGRVLNTGSIALDADGNPWIPYSIRVKDRSQAYLARPYSQNQWQHLYLNIFLPQEIRDWDLFMHGGISFGARGNPTVVATVMQVAADGVAWGEPDMEVVRFRSTNRGLSFTGELLLPANAGTPRWMPNIERPTGFNQMSRQPGIIFTEGERGESLEVHLSNRVWWIGGQVP